MEEKKTNRPGRNPKPEIRAQDVQGAKFLAPLFDLFRPLHEHCDDPKRKLHYDEYCGWLLLYFFTPVLDSVRGIQQASDIATVRKKLKLPRFSLGSFSESGGVFDPALLAPIVEDLCAKAQDLQADPRLRNLDKRPVAVDGTLLKALPNMVWALWRDEEHRAARLHLHLDLLSGTPEKATLTDGQKSEADELAKNLEANRIYITDRGFFYFHLMARILNAGSSFVGRVRENLVYETLEERPLSQGAKAQGIVADRIVRAGCSKKINPIEKPLRLVEIHVKDQGPARKAKVDSKSKAYRTRETDHVILLLTDLVDLDVETIALLYQYRWHIEIFFRWFKKVLSADKMLSLSENGLTIVAYCALIASALVVLWTGRKPTKRSYEMLCFYFSGWATEEELIAHIEKLPKTEKS